MGILRYLDHKRVLILRSKTKKGALAELCRSLAETVSGVSADKLLRSVLEREELLTTNIAPGIAIPHARIPGMKDTFLAMGKSVAGIDYDSRDGRRVHLVFLIVGDDQTHLRALAEVASLFRNPGFESALLRAKGKRALYAALTEPLTPEAGKAVQQSSHAVCEQALALAQQISAAALIVHHPPSFFFSLLESLPPSMRVLVAGSSKTDASEEYSGTVQHLDVPFGGLNRSSLLELSLLIALSKGLVHKGETVVSVFGLSRDSALDTITVTNVTREFTRFFSVPLEDKNTDMEQQVFIRVMQVATELAAEGREGKPVGALFIVGDYNHVSQRCHQMVMNPFKGYEEHERSILDPGLTETVKELSRIDGAIVIKGNGVIASAGAYVRVERLSRLPSGLGARHAAAAGITAITDSISIAVSESTRKISLFQNGERVMEL